MVRVRVRLRGFLAAQAGVDDLEAEFEGRSVGDLIAELVERFRQPFRDAVVDPVLNSPTPRVIITVNGVEVGCLKQLDTELRDGDIVDVIPTVHGG